MCQPGAIGRMFLNDESKEKNNFEGNKMAFLSTLGQKRWEKILLESNRKVKRKVDVEELKEDLWDIMVEFGEPIRMGTGLVGSK